jgi:hypothetical protein
MPTPVTSLPSATGQTMDGRPSARSAALRRPCSQMIALTLAICRLGPALRITAVYFLVVGSSAQRQRRDAVAVGHPQRARHPELHEPQLAIRSAVMLARNRVHRCAEGWPSLAGRGRDG